MTKPVSPFAKLAKLLEEDHIEAAERLAEPLGGLEAAPRLVRVLEDVAARREYSRLISEGESRRNAMRRAASAIGKSVTTVRFRLDPNGRYPIP